MKKKMFIILVGMCCFFANIHMVWADEVPKIPTVIELPDGVVIRGQVKTYDELFQFTMNYGDPEAPIKITEYTNIGCPDNYRIHEAIQDYLLNGIENGTIYYEYRHVKHPKFPKASEIFTRLSDIEDVHVLFDFISKYDQWMRQPIETISATYPLGVQNLEREIYQRMNYTEMRAKGITNVPAFIVNGTVLENADQIQDLEAFLDRIAPLTHAK